MGVDAVVVVAVAVVLLLMLLGSGERFVGNAERTGSDRRVANNRTVE